MDRSPEKGLGYHLGAEIRGTPKIADGKIDYGVAHSIVAEPFERQGQQKQNDKKILLHIFIVQDVQSYLKNIIFVTNTARGCARI